MTVATGQVRRSPLAGMHRWCRRVLAVVAAACLSAAVAWADGTGAGAAMPDVKLSAVLAGSGVDAGNGSGASGGVLAETVWLKGDLVRVDFDGGPRMRGRLLKRGDRSWLLEPDAQRALPVAHVPLASITRLDPAQPCLGLGLACEHVDDRLIAGRRATGWRYDHAGRTGPNATDSGVFWIDAQYGVLLGFRARDLMHRDYRMETLSVQFPTLPDSVFGLPARP